MSSRVSSGATAGRGERLLRRSGDSDLRERIAGGALAVGLVLASYGLTREILSMVARGCEEFQALSPRHLRVAVRSQQENAGLVAALDRMLRDPTQQQP